MLEPVNAEKGEISGSTQQARSPYALFDPAPAANTQVQEVRHRRMRRDADAGKSNMTGKGAADTADISGDCFSEPHNMTTSRAKRKELAVCDLLRQLPVLAGQGRAFISSICCLG